MAEHTDHHLDDRMDDRMDERLRTHAARWREDLPEVAPFSPRAPRRAGVVAAAAAAAVLVVVGAGVVLRSGTDRADAPPADRTSPSPAPRVVPWADLPPTHPTLPTTPAPACGPGDVAAGRPRTEGAAGTEYLTVDLRLTGDAPCWVSQDPAVTFLSAGEPLDLRVTKNQPDATPGTRVLVDGSHPATLTIGWAVSHSCPAVDNDEIRVTLGPNDVPLSLPGFGLSSCNPGEERSLPFVSPLQSAASPGAGSTSPWREVEVAGDLDLAAGVDEDVTFDVTLTSRVDLPLAACPDYVMTAGSHGGTYGLNCADVPYQDDAGDAYLPADTPVTFQMRVDGFDRAAAGKVVWRLDVRGTTALHGQLTVGDVELGTVTGTVTVVGGPAGTPDRVVTAGRVTATGPSGTDQSAIGPDGTYTLHLPPGAYDLEATPLAPLRGIVCPDRVGVTGGATVTADITCSID
ncbi:MAG TPA: DUF4232 domain-containing protein [Nocardioides sp.]|nr:DUF4232 domain-containing protein [Nocardioides sp.]